MIGENIKRERIKAGLTQKELGEKIGKTASYIGMYESGKRNPKHETLWDISEALGVQIWKLYDEEMQDIILEIAAESFAECQIEMMESGYTFEDDEMNLISAYCKLNEDGKAVALERVQELTEIPKYQRKD